jgi:hypothetical protein
MSALQRERSQRETQILWTHLLGNSPQEKRSEGRVGNPHLPVSVDEAG